jgi:hypothetical protein
MPQQTQRRVQAQAADNVIIVQQVFKVNSRSLRHMTKASSRKAREDVSQGHGRILQQHSQANGICERFHKTILQEFSQVAFRRKLYKSLEKLQRTLGDRLPQGANASRQDVLRQAAQCLASKKRQRSGYPLPFCRAVPVSPVLYGQPKSVHTELH